MRSRLRYTVSSGSLPVIGDIRVRWPSISATNRRSNITFWNLPSQARRAVHQLATFGRAYHECLPVSWAVILIWSKQGITGTLLLIRGEAMEKGNGSIPFIHLALSARNGIYATARGRIPQHVTDLISGPRGASNRLRRFARQRQLGLRIPVEMAANPVLPTRVSVLRDTTCSKRTRELPVTVTTYKGKEWKLRKKGQGIRKKRTNELPRRSTVKTQP